MSVFSLVMTGERESTFNEAIRLVFETGGYVKSHDLDKPRGALGYVLKSGAEVAKLQLVWGINDSAASSVYAQPFPFIMDYKGCALFVWQWLSQTPYGKAPDTDGSVKKGWKLDTTELSGWDMGIVEISPKWIIYGK